MIPPHTRLHVTPSSSMGIQHICLRSDVHLSTFQLDTQKYIHLTRDTSSNLDTITVSTHFPHPVHPNSTTSPVHPSHPPTRRSAPESLTPDPHNPGPRPSNKSRDTRPLADPSSYPTGESAARSHATISASYVSTRAGELP